MAAYVDKETANGVLFHPDGRVYHLEAKKGDIANRIVTVGSHERARLIASLFDAGTLREPLCSSRCFQIYTGIFEGVQVSVVSIGMGAQMMDFFLRELSAITTSNPLCIVRVGTCALFNPSHLEGSVLTARKGSIYCFRNYMHWDGCGLLDGDTTSRMQLETVPYFFTQPVMGDDKLDELLASELEKLGVTHFQGLNGSGENFYSCQGRDVPAFHDDQNEQVIPIFTKKGIDFLEMETHQLFHLAKLLKEPAHVAACAIGLFNRSRKAEVNSVTVEQLRKTEKDAGLAALRAVAHYKK